MGAHVQSGIAACFSIDEYDHDLIKKHEKTRPDKEDDRTRHMLAIGAQTGPVFLTYRASADIDAVVARVVAGPALFDVTAPDGVRHEVWVRARGRRPPRSRPASPRCPASTSPTGITARPARPARAARSTRAGPGEHDRVLAVAFPDNQMQVLPYNRVVRDLNGLTAEQFLAALKKVMPRARRRPGDARRQGRGGDVSRWAVVHARASPPGAGSRDRSSESISHPGST